MVRARLRDIQSMRVPPSREANNHFRNFRRKQAGSRNIQQKESQLHSDVKLMVLVFHSA